jgi:hypothetical protein
MMRVNSKATILITSGTPEKRMHYFEKYLESEGLCEKIDQFKIELSNLAQLINLLRTELKDKPLSEAMKNDAKVFKKVMKEMMRINREKEF